jgi:hypothetical protein
MHKKMTAIIARANSLLAPKKSSSSLSAPQIFEIPYNLSALVLIFLSLFTHSHPIWSLTVLNGGRVPYHFLQSFFIIHFSGQII